MKQADCISPCPSTISSVRPESVDVEQQPRPKKKRVHDELESLLMMKLSNMQDPIIDDEDELFGRQIAAVLRRFTKRQKAVAKLRIHNVLLDVEFPEETPQTYPFSGILEK